MGRGAYRFTGTFALSSSNIILKRVLFTLVALFIGFYRHWDIRAAGAVGTRYMPFVLGFIPETRPIVRLTVHSHRTTVRIRPARQRGAKEVCDGAPSPFSVHRWWPPRHRIRALLDQRRKGASVKPTERRVPLAVAKAGHARDIVLCHARYQGGES